MGKPKTKAEIYKHLKLHAYKTSISGPHKLQAT
jgi:hypothetical protein